MAAKLYYDARVPGSLGGVEALRKATGDSAVKTLDFLQGERTYTLHKPLRKTFPRNKTISWGIDYLWQADLVDLESLAKYNQKFTYLLTVIDVLSKYAWVVPLKNKKSATVLQAFQTIFKEGRKPSKLNTDMGGEFESRVLTDFFKKNNIIFYTAKGEKKAAVVERFNKTLKSRMWRYFTHKNTLCYTKVLKNLVHSYNRSHHKSIGMRPIDVNEDNEAEVRERLYGDDLKKRPTPDYKYEVGDTVRISKLKQVFEKGYLPNWTEEVFTISSRIPRRPPVYRVKDSNGEVILGTFYEQELQKVRVDKDQLYIIEKVLERKKRDGINQVLVKWKGYPKSMNSWIPASSLVKA